MESTLSCMIFLINFKGALMMKIIMMMMMMTTTTTSNKAKFMKCYRKPFFDDKIKIGNAEILSIF